MIRRSGRAAGGIPASARKAEQEHGRARKTVLVAIDRALED
jgi:hypothetical protein